MLTWQNPDPSARRPFILLRPFVAFWQWMFPPTQAHADRQSHASRVVAGFTIIAFCAALIAFVLMNGRKWHDQWQTWQSNRLVKKAEGFEKEERLLEAWIRANDAYMLDPENPNAIRTLARYYTARKQKEALYLLEKLEKQGVLTDDDVLLRIQALSNAYEDKIAQTKIEEVLLTSKASTKMVEVADHVMQRLGRREQLIDILKAYVRQKPDDLEIKLKLAMREVELGTPSEATEGMASLWELAANKEALGLTALEFLDGRNIATSYEQNQLVDLLEKHPLAVEKHRIAALRRRAVIQPERRTELIEKAMQERKDAKREDLVPLADWLNREGEHERLLRFLNEAVVQDYAPLLGHYLNALTLTKRYKDLERLVKDPRTRLTTAERAFYQVHLAFVTEKSWGEVNTLLVDALNAMVASRQPERLLQIAQWAEQRNHPLVAEQAYRAAATETRAEQVERRGFEGLLRLTYHNGNSVGFMEAARATARRWPDNQFFLERSLYASLLAGIEIEQAFPKVQKLLDASPTDTQRKLLMALALYRMADFRAAVDTLQNSSLSDINSAGNAAVFCGILHSAGLPGIRAQALQIASQIPKDAIMLPEEQRFLTRARTVETATPSPVAVPSPANSLQP